MNLSIIIPTLNEAESIGRLIERLLTQDAELKEIIVVDGGSTDATLSIVNSLGVKTVSCDCSRAKQMNVGAKAASHEFLYFVHADTLPPVDFHQDFFGVLNKDKRAATYRSKFVGGSKMLKLNAFFTKFKWLVSRGGDQSLFIGKEDFLELGGFDERMQIMEEYPLINKLMQTDRLELIPKYIEISTRKYESRSWLKVSRANYSAFKMYKKGLDSALIKKRYLKLLGKKNSLT